MSIYCGNNSSDKELLNGIKNIGTRYGCLKKGIGVGLNLPKDPKFSDPYTPILKENVYCGNKKKLPNAYDRVGSLPTCLQKGVGIGKKTIAMKFMGFNFEIEYKFIFYLLFFLITSSIINIFFNKKIKDYTIKLTEETNIDYIYILKISKIIIIFLLLIILFKLY